METKVKLFDWNEYRRTVTNTHEVFRLAWRLVSEIVGHPCVDPDDISKNDEKQLLAFLKETNAPEWMIESAVKFGSVGQFDQSGWYLNASYYGPPKRLTVKPVPPTAVEIFSASSPTDLEHDINEWMTDSSSHDGIVSIEYSVGLGNDGDGDIYTALVHYKIKDS